MQDRMLAGILLSELKQAVLQYTKAAMEATCGEVRRTFERLAYDTIRSYEQLRGILELNRMQAPAMAASLQDIRREAARSEEVRRGAKLERGMRLVSAQPLYAQRANAPIDRASPLPPEFMLPRDGTADALASTPPAHASVSEPEPKKEEPPKAAPKRGRKKAEPEQAQE